MRRGCAAITVARAPVPARRAVPVRSEEQPLTTPDHDDLRARAKDYVEHLPAKAALGNPDPEGGDRSDPKTFEETSAKGSEA